MARSRSGPLSGRPKTFWNACLYSLDSGELAYRGLQRGLAHFKGVNDRKARLLLEGLGPAIPKLRLVVEGVQDGGGVPLADSAMDADRNRPTVGEGMADRPVFFHRRVRATSLSITIVPPLWNASLPSYYNSGQSIAATTMAI